jgi:Protein of unknown function (DUF3489)
MAKSNQPRKPKPAAATKRASKPIASPKVITPKAAETSNNKSGAPTHSKQEQVLGLLRRPEGATIAAVTKVTGWQQHSVRGFLAGVVRKRLKLALSSTKIDGERVYKVAKAARALGSRQNRRKST